MGQDASGFEVYLKSVTKGFGTTVAVDDLTLGVAPGQLLALLGPSGCGKTTTLRVIAGLLSPSAGDVFIKDECVTQKPVHRRNVGMLFQNYALFPHMSVLRNVLFGLEMRRLPKSQSLSQAHEALRLVRLEGFEDRMPAQLSGGQQQRVALARALVIEPSVLLLDEPFGSIDKKLRENMQIELRALQERLGLTTILVTHDQEEAMTLANQIAVMRDGRIEQLGPPGQIYQRPVSRFVADFIGTSNFFTGRIDQRNGSEVRIRIAEDIALVAPAPDRAASTGDLLTVAVRPENIRLIPQAPQETAVNVARARVEQVVYRGLNTVYYMQLSGGAPLIVLRQATGELEASSWPNPGDEVFAAWEIRSNVIVRDTYRCE